MFWIGLDPGTHTGLAVWDDKVGELRHLATLPIHRALDEVERWSLEYPGEVMVIFEDARQRTWYGNDRPANAKLQGAGSIKRDCSIWEDFLKDYNIPFRAIPPQKGGTKLSEDYFKMITHWTKKTSNHARDAAMLVLGR